MTEPGFTAKPSQKIGNGLLMAETIVVALFNARENLDIKRDYAK